MNKKILTALLLFIVLLFASVSCFANTNLGTEMQDSTNKSQTTMQNAGEGIKNVGSDIGNGVQHAVQDVENGVRDIFDGNDGTVTGSDNEAVGIGANNNDNTGMGTTGNNGDYTATRTATDRITGTTMTNTAWVWLILGIVGVVIVSLTWYYVSQHNDRH